MRIYEKLSKEVSTANSLSLLIATVLATNLFSVPVAAEFKTDSLLFGQRHYYSVIFRGNGEQLFMPS